MEEIEGARKFWQPDTLAIAGAVVTIGHDGKAEIHHGWCQTGGRAEEKAEGDKPPRPARTPPPRPKASPCRRR